MTWQAAVQNLEAVKRQKDALESSRTSFSDRALAFIKFCREDVVDWWACSGEANMSKWGARFYLFSILCMISGSGMAYPGLLLHLRNDGKNQSVMVILLTSGCTLLMLSCCAMFFCTCHLNPVAISKKRRFQGSYV